MFPSNYHVNFEQTLKNVSLHVSIDWFVDSGEPSQEWPTNKVYNSNKSKTFQQITK